MERIFHEVFYRFFKKYMVSGSNLLIGTELYGLINLPQRNTEIRNG